MDLRIVEAVIGVNDARPARMVDKIRAAMGGDIAGKTVCLLGLTFKPNTDDLRESPAMIILELMLQAGATVRVYDPVAMPIVSGNPQQNVVYCSDEFEAAEGADALVLATEWRAFRTPDFKRLREIMRGTALFDGRNQWNPEVVRELGFNYYGIGRR